MFLEMRILFIKSKFFWKNGVPEKIKARLAQHPPALQQLFSHTFFILFKKLLTPPHLKTRAETAFYMIDSKGETIKLLPFYMTDFLFTEL